MTNAGSLRNAPPPSRHPQPSAASPLVIPSETQAVARSVPDSSTPLRSGRNDKWSQGSSRNDRMGRALRSERQAQRPPVCHPQRSVPPPSCHPERSVPPPSCHPQRSVPPPSCHPERIVPPPSCHPERSVPPPSCHPQRSVPPLLVIPSGVSHPPLVIPSGASRPLFVIPSGASRPCLSSRAERSGVEGSGHGSRTGVVSCQAPEHRRFRLHIGAFKTIHHSSRASRDSRAGSGRSSSRDAIV